LKHVFAFYSKGLKALLEKIDIGEELSFKDSDLWNRLTKIVRVGVGDKFIIFDENLNATLEIKNNLSENKRVVSGIILEKKENKLILPEIKLYLPVLKKDALECSIYVSAQMGVKDIFLIETKKSQKKFDFEKEKDRLKKIMISACEQSKNFVLPEIKKPIGFKDIFDKNLEQKKVVKIFFDEDGEKISNLEKIYSRNKIEIIIGPEGGFTSEEKNFLKNFGFKPYKLTPTILRSREAVCVGLGVLRSLI